MPTIIEVKPTDKFVVNAVNLWNEHPITVTLNPDSQYKAIIMADGRLQLYDGIWISEPIEPKQVKAVQEDTTKLQAALFVLITGIIITMPFWLPQLMKKMMRK